MPPLPARRADHGRHRAGRQRDARPRAGRLHRHDRVPASRGSWATSATSPSRRPSRTARPARRLLRGVPDPGLPVPAGRRGRALVGDDPGRRGPARERGGGAGVAGRLDRDDADAQHARGPRGGGAAAGARPRGVDHARLRRAGAAAHHGADPDHGPRAAVPGRGRRWPRASSTRAGGSGRRRWRRSSTTWDHRGRAVPRARCSASPASPIGVVIGAAGPPAGPGPDGRGGSACGSGRGSTSATRGAADARAHGAAGPRPRRDPGRVPRA